MSRRGALGDSTLRNLSDKIYEKRKAAALEVEQVIKNLNGDEEQVESLLRLLVNDYALSLQANNRKGGLIGLAAATVGLGTATEKYIDKIVPPVLHSFTDQDSRVRYYACEALYNIAKVSRNAFIPFFNDVFAELCKLSADPDANVQNAAMLLDRLVKDLVADSTRFQVEQFIPLVKERLDSVNPYVRQFLLGWITHLDNIPDVDMLEFLPEYLGGVMAMLGDDNREIRVRASNLLDDVLAEIRARHEEDGAVPRQIRPLVAIALSLVGSEMEHLQLTALTWDLLVLGEEELQDDYHDVLSAALPCLSHESEAVREAARRLNDCLLRLDQEAGDDFDVSRPLSAAREQLRSDAGETRLEALRWVSALLARATKGPQTGEGQIQQTGEGQIQLDGLPAALVEMLGDTSGEVVYEALGVLAQLALQDEHRFSYLVSSLFQRFRAPPGSAPPDYMKEDGLLQSRGGLIVRRLADLLGAERVFRALALQLGREQDLAFLGTMVQALHVIMLTSAELRGVRAVLKSSRGGGGSSPGAGAEGRALFSALYGSWCHSAGAALSLCFLAQEYELAAGVVEAFGELEVTVPLLMQMDQVVAIIESPVFTFLRLQLMRPTQHLHLVKALYGLLMILPQSDAFSTLRARLQCVPAPGLLEGGGGGAGGGAEGPEGASAPALAAGSPAGPQGGGLGGGGGGGGAGHAGMLALFREVQGRRAASSSRSSPRWRSGERRTSGGRASISE